jgi:dipeptidyl aminopeptidase/acylaminoacyl peptidase
MEIWICDSEGLNPIQLTSFGGAHTGTPRWSPDSHQIAFDSRPEGHADIYVISADGGKPRRLTTETSEDVVPSWSTDGRWIYFGSKRSGDWQIWKIQAEGGDAVQVTKKGGFAALESPDGKFVYYSNGPLWRIPVGGGAETPVPGFTEAVPSLQWAVSDHGIYFVRLEASSSRSHIEFFSFATGQVTQIVALEKKVFGGPSLSVSRDGRSILYVQLDRNDSDLMLVENFH